MSSLPVFWRRSIERLLLLFKKSKIGDPIDLLTLLAAIKTGVLWQSYELLEETNSMVS